MNDAYRTLLDALRPHYDAHEARQIALLVLEEAFGVGRTAAVIGEIRDFSEEEQRRFGEIGRRLRAGEPVQYVLGRAEFLGLALDVTPATLIPRPETEQLAMLAAGRRPRRALDAGTGSGCIALALKRAVPACRVEAWDISEEALAVARRNARRLGLDVVFRRVDLLRAAETLADEQKNGGFIGENGASEALDLIVSNPPYVCRSEAAGMAPHVLHYEPSSALFVPDDRALLFYEALAALGQRRLAPDGALMVEVNRAFAEETAALFRTAGYADVAVHRDFVGNPRFVTAVRR
ncbi:MAG: peptide chain release factor N(5)-glutamine methyltransferase [Prevotellaceae bacterium]|nr:peptide chain release factor N(5)-glutamine methyltransferase [Prevotellaceae bacterium]